MNDSRVMGLGEIEEEINRLGVLLEQTSQAIRRRGQEAADADSEFSAEWNKAFLLAKEGRLPGQSGRCSDGTARAHAAVLCADLLTRKNATKALLSSAKEAAHNYRARLDALRSLNSTVRALTVPGQS